MRAYEPSDLVNQEFAYRQIVADVAKWLICQLVLQDI